MCIKNRKWQVGDRVRYTSQDGAITDAAVLTVCPDGLYLFVLADEFKEKPANRQVLYGCHVAINNVVYIV